MGKADPVQYNATYHEPSPPVSMCVLCGKGLQPSENVVTRRGVSAHERCASAVLAILGRGEMEEPTSRAPEPERKSAATPYEKLLAQIIADELKSGRVR